MTLTSALERIGLNKQQQGFSGVKIEEAIETYNNALSSDHRQASLGSRRVYRELDHFHRSLSRKPQPTTIIRNWKRLQEAGQIFTEINLKIDSDVVKSFDDLTLDNPEHQELLRSAIGKARRWFYNKRGVEHGPAVRLLVRDVATIYKHATGKKPGAGSASAVVGPSYSTPFEDLLWATLQMAGVEITLQGTRDLFRSELKNKFKKLAS
ncbi:MAG: hypothetical protein HOM03_14490 [Marinovum sp.]|nr:hypothetical protein [Marinovum sp.]